MNQDSGNTPPASGAQGLITHALEPRPCRRSDAWLFILPVALVLAMLGIYLASPSFYTTYVLEYRSRETQAVEILTVLFAFGAAVMMYIAAFRLWFLMRRQPGVGRWPGGPLIIVVAATAAFFLGGEEINWGQTYLGYKSPEAFKASAKSNAFNLHNTEKLANPVRLLGNIYLLGMFVGLPIVWALRPRLKLPLPADWAPAVPEWTVTWCIAFSSLWRSYKDIYRVIYDEAHRDASTFYVSFLEQINEHRELLVTIALVIYAVHCLMRVRSAAAFTRSPDPTSQ